MNERDLFLAALDIDDHDRRRSYLATACAADNELRTRVQRLLDIHSEPSDVLAETIPAQLREPPTPISDVPTTIALFPFLGPATRPGSLGRLGHYEILELLGRGGFGIVFKAFDDQLHRIVAVKVLAPEVAMHPQSRQRFVREARAAAAVAHEHVVTIHAVEGNASPPYLVMQFVGGISLHDKLAIRGPLDVLAIARIGMQIASGLAAAHRQGLVHRDIKPANILLENGVERVKITDFGLARITHEAKLTVSGTIAGTPQYMSPEQARAGAVDARSDLFSLGSVLYTMCAGRPAFAGTSAVNILRSVCDDQPTPLREINPQIPQWLEQIVLRLMAKKPEDRFQSAREAADVLAGQLAKQQSPAESEVPAAIARPRKPAQSKGPRARSLISVGILLALAPVGLIVTESLGITHWFTATTISNPPPNKPRPGRDPERLTAPFSGQQGKVAQQQWSDYLGVPLEQRDASGITLVLIPPGKFLMGSSDSEIKEYLQGVRDEHLLNIIQWERPQHEVSLTRAFYLSQHEVTQSQYQQVMGSNPAHFSVGGEGAHFVTGKETASLPIESASWNDAARFCNKLSEQRGLTPLYHWKDERMTLVPGNGYRLPTEAEWEYACRAGTTGRQWADGAALATAAWSADNSGGTTHAVREKVPNPFGLYDTNGNVWEWVHDGWDPEFYAKCGREKTADPVSPLNDVEGSKQMHVARGGSWNNSFDSTRSANRLVHVGDTADSSLGFRIALPIEE